MTWEERETELGFEWNIYNERVELMNSFINTNVKSICDWGAGMMYLKSLIRKEVLYYPVDYKKRCEETIVCNFNSGEFPANLEIDVSFMSGILEYIEDIPSFLAKVCSCTKNRIIISYSGMDLIPELECRKSRGWSSNYFIADLIYLFLDNSFVLTNYNTMWKHQPILIFDKINNVKDSHG